jgi:hypothetical protein
MLARQSGMSEAEWARAKLALEEKKRLGYYSDQG